MIDASARDCWEALSGNLDTLVQTSAPNIQDSQNLQVQHARQIGAVRSWISGLGTLTVACVCFRLVSFILPQPFRISLQCVSDWTR